jgi:transcriptional regulator with XRE-family HTH domain
MVNEWYIRGENLAKERGESMLAAVEGIGENVRKMRRRRLLTQGELAEKARIGLNTVNRIERGQVEPHFGTIKKLAAALDVPPEELVRETS